MKLHSLTKWAYTPQLEGLLFLAQVLDEQLFMHTIDSFKAPALNVHTAVHETVHLATLVLQNRLREPALQAVRKELAWHLHNDPVLEHASRPVIAELRAVIAREDSRTHDVLQAAKALLGELDAWYWASLLPLIKDTVQQPREKKRLTALANSLIAECELMGISRAYLYRHNFSFFFDPAQPPAAIAQPSDIDTYLAALQQDETEWTVVYRVSRHFQRLDAFTQPFGITIGEAIPPDFADLHGERFLAPDREFPFFFTVHKIEARVPHVARDYADARIAGFSDVIRFHYHHKILRWSHRCLVRRNDKSQHVLLHRVTSAMLSGAQLRRSRRAEGTTTSIEILAGAHLTHPATAAYRRAIEYHRAAIESRTLENQLLDLWAVLEGFLPPPRDNTDRIVYYCDALTPSLTMSYIVKLITDIADGLSHAGPDVRRLLEDTPVAGGQLHKAAALLATDEQQARREELFAALSTAPHLRFRCHTYYEMLHSTARVRAALAAHKQRLSWHIRRIYNSRNQIIHSAHSLPYLRTLVENMHSYVDCLVFGIATLARRAGSPVDIASCLMLMESHLRAFDAKLALSDVRMTLANFGDLLFGKDNPYLAISVETEEEDEDGQPQQGG